MSVDALTVERWVGEGIIKCAHIVLSARVHRPSRTAPRRSRSNWFKLEVEEVEDAAGELSRYRRDIIQQPQGRVDGEIIVEQWNMQFDGLPPTHRHHLRTINYDDEPTQIYKCMCVMARTLYSYVRVLPAYRLYRACHDNRDSGYKLTYRLLHTSAPGLQPAESRSNSNNPRMKPHIERFAFAPIETMTGSLQISVQYQAQVVPDKVTRHIDTLAGYPHQHLQHYPFPPQGQLPYFDSQARRSVELRMARTPEEQARDGDDARGMWECTTRCSTTRAHPTAIPQRRETLLLPTHPCSAPSDFAFARHSPSHQGNSYTHHLAQHMGGQLHKQLQGHPWHRVAPQPRPRQSRESLGRVSGSSGASLSCPFLPPSSSPVSPSVEISGGHNCRALVRKSSSSFRGHQQQVVLQLDSSVEAKRLFSSPDGLLRASSGKSEALSGRWGSPAVAEVDLERRSNRQLLIEHSSTHQTSLDDTLEGCELQLEPQTSMEDVANLSDANVEGDSQDGSRYGTAALCARHKAVQGLHAQLQDCQKMRSHPHHLSASAPLASGSCSSDRELEIKDFLLQLEQPVLFRHIVVQDQLSTVLDIQRTSQEILLRWGFLFT